jgi:NAD(P)H-hydrate epimerase
MIVLSPERMKGYDAYAIDTWGIPSAVLMENAGRTTYRLMKGTYLTPGAKLAVVCGRGNNGGDGFVIARYALRDGFHTEAYLLGEAASLKGDALVNMHLFQSMGGSVTEVRGDLTDVSSGLARSDVIVDAILGTGLAKEVRGTEGAVIDEINRSGKTVIAVDIPSGLDGLRGVPLGRAVRATHTYTYGHPKVGHLLHPGVSYRGRLTVVDISLPAAAVPVLGIDARLVDGRMLRGFFRQRPPDAHKGMFGNIAVIAGSTGKTGAAIMTTMAALRIGAGLVTLAAPQSLAAIAASKLTEAMTLPVDDNGKGCFVLSSYGALRDFAAERDIVILGPGLGREPETGALVRRLHGEIDKPFVIDADGVNAFEGHLDALKARKGNTVLTPHPGEFGRLVGKGPREVNADRLELGRSFAVEHGVTLVLKGAPTITFSPRARPSSTPRATRRSPRGDRAISSRGSWAGLRARATASLNRRSSVRTCTDT